VETNLKSPCRPNVSQKKVKSYFQGPEDSLRLNLLDKADAASLNFIPFVFSLMIQRPTSDGREEANPPTSLTPYSPPLPPDRSKTEPNAPWCHCECRGILSPLQSILIVPQKINLKSIWTNK
jgi:hypothetical protein